MDEKRYKEMWQSFTDYMSVKKMRKTEERYAIFECICHSSGHFDVNSISEKLEETNFHVSKATLYNTLDVLLDAGLVVRHQFGSSVEYELRSLADTHLHLVCTRCGAIREMKDSTLRKEVGRLRTPRFTPEFHALYIYGICSKCTFKMRAQNEEKNINKPIIKTK